MSTILDPRLQCVFMVRPSFSLLGFMYSINSINSINSSMLRYFTSFFIVVAVCKTFYRLCRRTHWTAAIFMYQVYHQALPGIAVKEMLSHGFFLRYNRRFARLRYVFGCCLPRMNVGRIISDGLYPFLLFLSLWSVLLPGRS